MHTLAVRLLTVALCFTPLASVAADTYTMDPNHTYVLWHAKHFGFSTQTGKFRANGKLSFDEKNLENSKVDVTIQIADLATGVPEFDKHIQGKLFLNALKFPTATFKSDKVTVTDKQHVKLAGTLTLLGIAKPVTLDVTLNKNGINPLNDKQTLGFTAQTELNRADFGIITLIPNVSGSIPIDIQVEAIKDGK